MSQQPPFEQAIRFDQLELEHQARLEAAAFIGRVIMEQTVQAEPENVVCLKSAIEAAEYDEKAMLTVQMNAKTAVLEALLKAGNVIRAESEVTTEGKIVQGLQSQRDIHRNTLLFRKGHAGLRELSMIEVRNGFRIEQALASGLLEDYYVLVPSLVSSKLPTKVSADGGYFTDTMSAAFQLTTLEDGKLVTDTAFVAGVDETGGVRHDVSATVGMLEDIGIESDGDTTAMLDSPILIPKKMLPNGVIDIARLYDKQLGEDYFFGQKGGPPCSYDEMRDYCQKREARLDDTVQSVVSELLVGKGWYDTPEAATAALAQIVKRHAVGRVIGDHTIDASVLGRQAAYFVEEARFYASMGDQAALERATEKVHETADVRTCGFRLDKNEGNDPESGSENNEQPTGKIRCVKCKEKVPAKEVIKPKSWCCPKCKYEVDVCTGKVLNSGSREKPEPSVESLERKDYAKTN